MFLPFTAGDTFGVIEFTFDWTLLLQFILAFFLPLLVAVVTKRVTPGLTKVSILGLLTIITTVLTEILGALTSGTVVDLFAVLLTALGSFVVSVATYAGVWDAGRADKPSIAKTVQMTVGVK